jgi:hypothetical protein
VNQPWYVRKSSNLIAMETIEFRLLSYCLTLEAWLNEDIILHGEDEMKPSRAHVLDLLNISA